MKVEKSLVILSAIIFAAFSVLQFTVENITVIADTTFFLVALAASISLWIAAAKTEFPDERKIWMTIATAVTIQTIAEAIWGYMEAVQGIQLPTPSIADAFWLTAYPIFIIALWMKIKTIFQPTKRLIESIIAGTIALFLTSFLIIRTITTNTIEIGTILDFAYPLLDIIIIMLLAVLIIPLIKIKHKIMLPWIFIAASYLTVIIFDYSYAILSVFDAYETGAAIDIIYVLSYVLLSAAAYTKARGLK